MTHPLEKVTRTAPLQNNLRAGRFDFVVVMSHPTWDEYKTRNHFSDPTAMFVKAVLRQIDPSKRARFVYAVPHPTPGNRQPTPDELKAAAPRLKQELEQL